MVIICAVGDLDVERRRSVAAFDAASADCDTLTAHLWGPVGADTMMLASPRPGESVLDACCGTGASAILTAQLVGATGHVDAVDQSAAMVEILRGHATRPPLPQLRATQADMTGWTQGGYDLVQCVLGIFFLPDMAAGTRRVVSHCRPGGRIAFTIWRAGAVETPADGYSRPSPRLPKRSRHRHANPIWSSSSAPLTTTGGGCSPWGSTTCRSSSSDGRS